MAALRLRARWNATLSPGDTVNITRLVVFPYVNGQQWGAEAAVLWQAASCAGAAPPGAACVGGSFVLPLPAALSGSASVLVAVQPPPGGPTVGTLLPPGSLASNALAWTLAPAVGKRRVPATPGSPTVGVFFETWFTPLNFFWAGGVMTAEAIPLMGRYDSFNTQVMAQQLYWLARAGVDAMPADWTNNLWNTPSWADRAPNVQEIVNATSLLYGVTAGLARDAGWDTPRQLLLLGLDNGPTAPWSAIEEEMAYIASAYIGNASVGADQWVDYLGSPLIVIFDGTGANHSGTAVPGWTLRWMASQDQATGFNLRGYWSWMDGTLAPPVTPWNGGAEAVTASPAFFAADGWLAPSAVGHAGGVTAITEWANAFAAVGVAGTTPNLSFLWMSQWAEYAGQANGAGYGPNHDIYVDSYSAELSNEVEPTSTTACAYRRPGVACGGWGMRPLNILSMLVDATRNVAALDDGVVVLAITTPTLGAIVNYTDASNSSVTVAWTLLGFNSSALTTPTPSYLTTPALPVTLAWDGVVAAAAPAGTTTAVVPVSSLDPRYPHRLTIRAGPPTPGSTAHLTRYPLSLDVYDEAAPLPVGAGVPAAADIMVHLPPSVW